MFQWPFWFDISIKRIHKLIKYIIHYSFNHTPLILYKQCICQHITKVKVSRNLISEWLNHYNRLPHCMIENRVVFLPQDWLQSLSIINNRHVITVNIGQPSHWHTHYSNIVSESMEWIHSGIYCYKLRSKDRDLDSWFLLRQPIY